MSANCNFSKKYLPLVYIKANTLSAEEFENWVKDNFINAEVVLKSVKSGELFKSSLAPSRTKVKLVPSIARKIIDSGVDNPTIDSLYLGSTDLRLQMEQRFMEDIVALTVFDRTLNDGRGKWIDFDQKSFGSGLSQGNENIRMYKCKLIEELYSEMKPGEDPTFVYENMTPQEYDGTIKTVLKDYRNFLKSHPKAGNAFIAYSILQNFDNLIKAKAPFIEFNENFTYDFADKYIYKGPTVEHYTGFTTDESAAIEKQDSDLAKLLLNTMPEIDENGKPIQGSFIGLSGFNSAMTSLKRAILFSPYVFSEEYLQTYFSGLEINLDKLISEYINQLNQRDSILPQQYKSFLVSKLRSIQKYIYQSGIDPIIKNMFTQMFFKTELVSYRGYSYDDNSNSIKGKNLRLNNVNSQRYQLEDWIRGAGYLLKNNSDIKQRLKQDYNIQVNGNTVTLSKGMNTMIFTFGDTSRNNKSKTNISVSGSYEQSFAEKAIFDFLSIVVPDTYMSIGVQISGRTFRLMDDFTYPLGLVIGKIYGDVQSIPSSQSGIIDLKQYTSELEETAKKLGVIYGSETKNVVKSPSGNNLPCYQLTNMSYNVASLLHDAKEFSKRYPDDLNPYENHLFNICKDLLCDLQVRSEIKIGNNVKSPDKLTTKELIQLSVLEDFYKPLIGGDGVIYLQNATFADKSTHYLPGYKLDVELEEGLNLGEALKSIANNNPSNKLSDFTRSTRLQRHERIVRNILSDYKKVFFENGRLKHGFGCSVNFDFTSLDGLDLFLQNAYKVEKSGKQIPLDVNIVKAEFDKTEGVSFEEEIHATKPRNKTLGKIRVNETLKFHYESEKDKSKWEQLVNNARNKFITSISNANIKWNRYDNGTMYKIWDKYKAILGSEWFDTNSGDMKLYVGNKLHPILESYFIAEMLLSNEYNALTIGEVWAHPNKNRDLTNIDVVENINTTFIQSTGDYAQRTRENINWSDVTLALAVDFTTAGERLTKNASGNKYISVKLQQNADNGNNIIVDDSTIDNVISELKKRNGSNPIKLNIAGNGIYSFKYGSQESINDTVTSIIEKLLDSGIYIQEIRTGGQTGVDEAGIIAAQRLNIKNSINAPRGWKMRTADNNDISNEQVFKQRFVSEPEYINVWFGTNENAILSNFAIRPFTIDFDLNKKLSKSVGFSNIYNNELTFESVEKAFQIAKIAFSTDLTDGSDTYRAEILQEQILQGSSKDAKQLGRSIPLSPSEIALWDSKAPAIMKFLIKESFKQNPQALQKLFETGNSQITHIQETSKWKTEFPKLLMEVRSELADELNVKLNSINRSKSTLNKEHGTYEEFSEASRLVSQIKRSVIFGATYHPFAQNLPNGVASEIDIAVLEDVPGFVFSPNGDGGTIDSMDGSGYADDLQARFESNSLIDARVGENKKTIMADVDMRYGKPILLKWAVYSLTNEIRRVGVKSKISAENLCKKMRSKPIRNIYNISTYYNQRTDKIIYEDYRTGKRYRIDNVDLAGNSYVRYKTEIGKDGEPIAPAQPDYIPAGTLYSLDQLFGGAWTCKYDESTGWTYTDANTDMLEEILSRSENQDLKKGFIAYAVNKSAIKVGAGNVNSKDSWADDSELRTISMHTKYGGLQMDADHELENSDVSEMTQMISALVQGGHYPEIVKEIYTEIGDVVLQHLDKYLNKINIITSENTSLEEKDLAKSELRELLGKSLIAAFETGSKDTLGLAQAFVKKAEEAIKNNEKFDIPFSAATINGAFISDVMSGINKGGIRRKFAGFAGVLNPSHNVIETFRIYNDTTKQWEIMLFPQFAEHIRNLGYTGEQFNTIFNTPEFTKSYNVVTNNIEINSNNPLVRPITLQEIDFEDTIYVVDDNGNIVDKVYINNTEEYYKVKLNRTANIHYFVDSREARNLRGADTRFKDEFGNEYSVYDLTSVIDTIALAKWYRNTKEEKTVGDAYRKLPEHLQDYIYYVYLEPIPVANAENTITQEDLLNWIEDAKNATQTQLKNIEHKKQIEVFESGNFITPESWRTRPAEIITGRYQWEKFGLPINTNIQDVKDASIFRELLRDKYSPLKDEIDSNLYDIVLYGPDGERFYVKIGSITDTNETYSNVEGVTDSNAVKINGDNVYFSDEVSTKLNGKQFKMIIDEYGKQTQLIAVESIDDYKNLLKCGWFDRFYQHYNYNSNNINILKQLEFGDVLEYDIWIDGANGIPKITTIQDPSIDLLLRHREILKDKKINKSAESMYESFKLQLRSIGARIPTQGMQSFMPTDCIAVVNNLKNVLYVPKMDPFLKGSDFKNLSYWSHVNKSRELRETP